MTSCAACGSVRRSPDLEARGYRYARCENCGLRSLDPLPEPDSSARLYQDGSYFEGASGKGGYSDYLRDEPLHRQNARSRLASLERAGVRPPGRLLEIGSAAGILLDEARTRGWAPVGVDVSSWAREKARSRFDVEVRETVGEALATHPGSWDAAVALQVVEHLPDPASVLRSLRASLKPEARLLIETWDAGSSIARLAGARWQQVTPPSVIHLFDRRSLTRLLEGAGFTVISYASVAKSVSLGLVLGQLGEKIAPLRPLGDRLGRGRVGRVGLSYRLGDLVAVMARPR